MDAQPANQIAEAARQGDKAAATRLLELFYERIYAFLRRLASNDADAADLTQRTFSRVWQALPTFAGRSSFSSWIHGIAHHVYVDWRRANHRLEPRSPEWWDTRVATGPAPDESVADADLAATLFSSVDKLEPDLRD
ncbi:MAG: RNA polymerase sigma factor, partial [Verrucomicrobiota bacterium]